MSEWVKLPSDSKIYPLIRSEIETQLFLEYYRKEYGKDPAPNINEWDEGQLKEKLYIHWYKKLFYVNPPKEYDPPVTVKNKTTE